MDKSLMRIDSIENEPSFYFTTNRPTPDDFSMWRYGLPEYRLKKRKRNQGYKTVPMPSYYNYIITRQRKSLADFANDHPYYHRENSASLADDPIKRLLWFVRNRIKNGLIAKKYAPKITDLSHLVPKRRDMQQQRFKFMYSICFPVQLLSILEQKWPDDTREEVEFVRRWAAAQGIKFDHYIENWCHRIMRELDIPVFKPIPKRKYVRKALASD